MPAKHFAASFMKAMHDDPLVMMAYGRLNVTRYDFFEEALLVTYRPVPPGGGLQPAGEGGFASAVSREMYRAQIGSEGIKRTRWFAETVAAPRPRPASRPATP